MDKEVYCRIRKGVQESKLSVKWFYIANYEKKRPRQKTKACISAQSSQDYQRAGYQDEEEHREQPRATEENDTKTKTDCAKDMLRCASQTSTK